MIRPTAYCDECGRSKGDANHWFRAILIPGRLFIIVPWHLSLDSRWISELGEQSPDFNAHMEEMHLCSESCAVKAMAKAVGSTSTGESELKP